PLAGPAAESRAGAAALRGVPVHAEGRLAVRRVRLSLALAGGARAPPRPGAAAGRAVDRARGRDRDLAGADRRVLCLPAIQRNEPAPHRGRGRLPRRDLRPGPVLVAGGGGQRPLLLPL